MARGLRQTLLIILKKCLKFMNENDLINMMAGRSPIPHVKIMENTIFTKAIDWSYEREWRVSAGRGRNDAVLFEDIPFNPQELEAVYFGCRMGYADRKVLVELVAARSGRGNAASE